MPGMTPEYGDLSVSVVEDHNPKVYTFNSRRACHSPPRLSLAWGRGNTLRVSFLESEECGSGQDQISGGEVVEVNLSNVDGGDVSDAQWRRIAYGSVAPFAMLQSRKNSVNTSKYEKDRWDHVIQYSKEISSLLSSSDPPVTPAIEDPMMILNKVEEPTALKAAWELLVFFYVEKQSKTWIPERLLDWLAEFDCLFSGSLPTVHGKLVDFQEEVVAIKAVENDPKYWEVMSAALAVGWLDVVVKLLRMHGSYFYDQLGTREIENGLVEAVALLISQMPRFRPDLPEGKLGDLYKTKPEFMKAWEKWRAQITKLDCSTFWLRCGHQQTRIGLKNMLQILLGNTASLSNSTCHWIELCVSHFLYIRPFTMGLESIHGVVHKCEQLKPTPVRHKLMELLLGILEENTEVVLAECLRSFGPWMTVHAIELLTAGSSEADAILHEEESRIGGLSMEELHRLVYAQILASHALTWNIAPIYLTSCMKQGLGLLENLLHQQPVQNQQILVKTLEICRLNGLDHVARSLMKVAGVHFWKHGKKGSGLFWLQQGRDEARLNRIVEQLFDSVAKPSSSPPRQSFEQWERIVEVLGNGSSSTVGGGGLQFLKGYRDFRRALERVEADDNDAAAEEAAEALISLMKNPATPQQFWLPLLHDSVKVLNWKGRRPVLSVSGTNFLLKKLQELSLSRLLPGFARSELPAEALKSVRLALATALGRAFLEEE